MEHKAKKKTERKRLKPITILYVAILLFLVVLVATNVQNYKKIASQKTMEVKIATKATTKNQFVEESSTMHNDYDASGDRVPVPNGYVGSSVAGENEMDTGYVIYEREDPVTDANVEEARKTRNQYVWVPVPDASKLYGTDSNGKKWGKLYSFTTSTGSNIDPVTGAKPYNWSESNGIMTINSKTNDREADIVMDYDYDSRLKTTNIGTINSHEFLMQLEKEFNNMIESVETYGGFYIGRYETGGLNSEAVVAKGDTNLGSQNWWNMYMKLKGLKGTNENVETGMIWGSQWDRTLMWLIESGDKTKEQIITDSGEWGNYYNNSIEYVNSSGETVTTTENKSTKIPAGSSEQTKANNIYDLAGNVYDWTIEANSAYIRVLRGGVYDLYSTNRPARYRSYGFPTASVDFGGRAALYIQ